MFWSSITCTRRRTRTLVWCATFTCMFTERFCWKFCKVKLLWEVSLSSFSLWGWKWYSLFDFSWWVTPETSHSRRNVRMEQWESPCSLSSLIQQIGSYSSKWICMGTYLRSSISSLQRARVSWARLCPCAYTPVQRARMGRATATSLSSITLGVKYSATKGTQPHRESFPGPQTL